MKDAPSSILFCDRSRLSVHGSQLFGLFVNNRIFGKKSVRFQVSVFIAYCSIFVISGNVVTWYEA